MPGKKINEPCCVCGRTKEETRLGRFEGKVYCQKHLHQFQRHGRLLSPEEARTELTVCAVCGSPARATRNHVQYCQRHYMQMYHHGYILERTIFDRNTYMDHPEEGYTECITYDKDLHENGRVKIDLDQKPLIEKYKIYIRNREGKRYAMMTVNGIKIFLHRYLLGLRDKEYTLDKCVDHINGDSLDNRLSNLRVCHQRDNAKNNKGKCPIVGVGWLKYNKKWTARIMSNYKGIHIGNYDSYEEAALARLKKEKELCGDFGPNKDLFYIIEHPSPIEELRRVLQRECNRIG